MKPMVKSSLALMASLAAIGVAGPSSASAASTSNCPDAAAAPSSITQAPFADAVLCLLNNERRKRNMKPLRINDKLSSAALGHTLSMREGGYFAHDEPTGSTFSDRILSTGYTSGARRWMVGENLAWGSGSLGTPKGLMRAWMNSPPHRANILERRYREIGLGIEWGTPTNPAATNGAIVTTDFGSRG